MAIERILITGSSGTIGTRLFERLSGDYSVIGVDRKPNKWNKKIDKQTIKGDLLREETFRNISPDQDLVIHLAANSRVYDLIINPELALENVQTLFRTLEFCREKGIKKFIFASSREVYGDTKGIHPETDALICESPYTASKIGGEALVHAYQKYGINFVIPRFSNVYGMYDEKDRVIPKFIKNCRERGDLDIFGGDKLLDFIYINDAVEGVRFMVEQFELIEGDTFNIASGKGVSIMDVAKIIREKMNSSGKINIKENRPGEVMHCIADITKARNVLRFNPKVDINEGLERSIDWYENH
ncbi:NAD-dependent epimerase/dehydratase family protein [Candidatus Pacearchaeota archaeon]|nr:NAD-dependent epimerase/dehydratase family protein [Candidatus Pacearchaeota archaeon]